MSATRCICAVELQSLWRLPRSNAILFVIRCYLIKMEEVVTVPKWGRRLPRVLRSLPPELVDYKGLTRYRQTTIDWLSKYDDGAPTSPGIFPDLNNKRKIHDTCCSYWRRPLRPCSAEGLPVRRQEEGENSGNRLLRKAG